MIRHSVTFDKLVPKPGSLAATDWAARGLYIRLKGILEWFDWLRRADFDEPGDTKPQWWDHFDQHPKWRKRLGQDMRPVSYADRVSFTCLMARNAIAETALTVEGLDCWMRLTDPIPKTPMLEQHLKSAVAALRYLRGALDNNHKGPRLRYGVVPDERHLAVPLPGTWSGTEEMGTDEIAANKDVDSCRKEHAKKHNSDATLAAKLQAARERSTRLRDERHKRNDDAESHARENGLATPEELRKIQYAREQWRETIVDWNLRVAAVQKLIDYLGGVDATDTGDEYRPATWFRKGMAARLRMAARPTRKTKRVRTKTIDGVVCYSVADARMWWPHDVPAQFNST
jgi:hypothetical protein